MATSMIKKARTTAQKAATKKWQAAGAAKRKANAQRQRYNSPAARKKRVGLMIRAMKEAGYGKGKDPHGMSAAAKIARYDKSQSIYRSLIKKYGSM